MAIVIVTVEIKLDTSQYDQNEVNAAQSTENFARDVVNDLLADDVTGITDDVDDFTIVSTRIVQ